MSIETCLKKYKSWSETFNHLTPGIKDLRQKTMDKIPRCDNITAMHIRGQNQQGRSCCSEETGFSVLRPCAFHHFFRVKFLLGCLHEDRAKSNGCARTLLKTSSGLLKGKCLLFFGFQQRLLSKGTGNHPSVNNKLQAFPSATRTVCGNRRSHMEEQGGPAPS